MDDAGVEGTFVLRASGPAAGREVTVIAVRAESCEVLDELVALAAPRSGLVLVALGAVDGVGLRAVVDDAGAMELEPLGMVLEAIGVSHEAAANTAVLLDAAAEHLTVEDLDPIDGGRSTASRERRRRRGRPTSQRQSPWRGWSRRWRRCAGPTVSIWSPLAICWPATTSPTRDGSVPTPALLVRVLGKPRLEPEPAELSRHERMVVVYVASIGW